MIARSARAALILASLSVVAAGCSRTYDGSIVPTYEVAAGRFAGIPVFTLKQTPLDLPNLRGMPPSPALSPAEPFDAAEGAEPVVAPARPRPVRRAAARDFPTAKSQSLRCRDKGAGERLVRMVCE